MNKLRCKYHPSAVLIEDYSAGDLVCSICALVVGDRVIDFSSEWRSFADDGDGVDNCRVGAVETALTSNTATSITVKQSYDPKHLDENGKQKYKSHTNISPAEKSLRACFEHITTISSRLNITQNITKSAQEIVLKLSKIDGFSRKNKEVIAAACVYYSCKEHHVERSYKEIAAVMTIAKSNHIVKMYKQIISVLGMTSQNVKVEQLIPRYLYKLQIKNKNVEKLCIEICKKAQKHIHKKPSTLISASIYMACLLMDVKISKENIKNVVEVSLTTITSAYKILYSFKENLISEPIKLQYSLANLPSE